MGGRGSSSATSATSRRNAKGTDAATSVIRVMVASQTYNRSEAIRETAKRMKTTSKQAEKYVNSALSKLSNSGDK